MDAAAVVAHANAPHAGLLDLYADGRRPGIEAVFQQFLNDGGRALHHLSGGDLIGDEVRQRPDAQRFRDEALRRAVVAGHVSRCLGRRE